MHCNKLNRGAYVCIVNLILNGFGFMIWPRFIKFIKLSPYMVVKQMNFKLESKDGELCTESSLVQN